MSDEKLIQLAFVYGILTDYRVSPQVFHLHLYDGTVVKCNPAEARFYVMGLLYGRLYTVDRLDPKPPTDQAPPNRLEA